MSHAVRLLAGLVIAGVLGSLAVAAGPLTWHLRGQSAALPPETAAAAPPAAAAQPADISPIFALAPFGSTLAVPAPQADPGTAQLNMTLLGIIIRADPTQSLALIDNGGIAANFKAGAKITETVSLNEVKRDHVVLDVGGTLQILAFASADVAMIATPDSPVTGVDRLLAAMLAQPDKTEPPKERVKPPPETMAEHIDYWRDQITANPQQVLDTIGLLPSADGYIIAEQHDSGVARAGLRSGDLVKSVNGQPVGNVDSDRRLFDDVAASGLAKIEIQRDGRSIVMSFPLK